MATTSPPHADLRTTAQPKFAIPRATPRTILRLWHLTSLDAPTVAVTWTLAFAWVAQIRLPLWLPSILALSAWTFYIADRLMDAKSAFNPAASSLVPASVLGEPSLRAGAAQFRSPGILRPRHYYHWQHRRIFLPIAILSALAALTLVFYYMPLPAREPNSILAAATLLYFTTVHTPPGKPTKSRIKFSFPFPKELLVGILFTLACTLPVWTLPIWTRIPTAPRTDPTQALLIATPLFIALAWLNCHAIESWESKSSQGRVARLSLLLAAVTATAAIATMHHPRIGLLLLAASLSATLLASLDHMRATLHPTTLRAAADLALLTPLLLLALPL